LFAMAAHAGHAHGHLNRHAHGRARGRRAAGHDDLASQQQLRGLLRAAGTLAGSQSRAPLPSSMARADQQLQQVQAPCSNCQARNQLRLQYSPDPVAVQCGRCSRTFRVQVPAPPLRDACLCRHCGSLNRYVLPEVGAPFPGIECGVCGLITQRPGNVAELHRWRAEQLEASMEGPSVMVEMGGRRQPVPIRFLRALVLQEEAEDRQKSKAAGDADIDALPVQMVDQHKHLGDQMSCAICFEEFQEGDELKTLPCLHIFHKKEIDDWLHRDNSCPICKTPVGDHVKEYRKMSKTQS